MTRLLDYGERLFLVLLCLPFLLAFARVLPMHPWALMLVTSEALAVVLILIRKPGSIATAPYAFAIGFIGTGLPLFIRPVEGSELLPTAITSSVMAAGLALNIASKLFLNRSFGVVAANRGIKSGGPYRLVRHPMYLGYIITQMGFLFSSFNLLNLAIYATAWTAQVLRIREEEKFLMHDEAYRELSTKVPYRLVPGLY